MEGLERVTPDKEKARSILEMIQTTLKMIDTIDFQAFPSNVLKEYYDVLQETMTILLLLDGFKTYGEGAHKKRIEHIERTYDEIGRDEIELLESLRSKRNRVVYDGFFIPVDFIKRREPDIKRLVKKIKNIICKKLYN